MIQNGINIEFAFFHRRTLNMKVSKHDLIQLFSSSYQSHALYVTMRRYTQLEKSDERYFVKRQKANITL